MKRLVFAAVYFGLIAFLGGVLAERHGYLDRLIGPASKAVVADAPPRKVHYRAVLVAGDGSIPNFDNAVEALVRRFIISDTETTILTSDGGLVDDHHHYATAWAIDESLSNLGQSDACLVFVTSHGNEYGLVMAMDNAEGGYLTPARLAEILAQDCGARPTVAILSGCHAGTFLTKPMMTENRIILTAARRDRTSFGCSTDTTYTYFDECLLDAMDQVDTWRAIFDRTKACIERKETAGNIEPSLPQAFFGADVQDLGIE